MSYFAYIVTFLICAVLVPTGKAYRYYPEAKGWVSRHPIVATWDEALKECRAEGAVLMSPTTDIHLRVMQSLIDGNTWHYLGTTSMLHPRLFVSTEGVSLTDMPISEILKPLKPQVALCLAMDHVDVYSVSCTTTLPFFCYKNHDSKLSMTECGTFDTGYILNNVTGSCYKFYNENKVWNDAYWTCVTEGAYLAIANDAVEAQQLANLGKHQGNHILIGLRIWNETGEWMSVHAEPLLDIYHDFNSGIPTDTCCKVGSMSPSNLRLYTKLDTESRPFICEKDPNNIRYSITDQQQIDIY